MKSMVWKDLYNIAHNAQAMVFILLLMAAVYLPGGNAAGYIVVCAVLCSMMIVTTFSFDDQCQWASYAMVMPVTRSELVGAKFVVLAIFCLVGSLFGLVASLLSGLVFPNTAVDLGGTLMLTLAAWSLSYACGGMSIPLVLRFGAERGRILLAVSFLLPAGLCVGAYQLLCLAGVVLTDGLTTALLAASPVAAALWCYGMYRVGCCIFARQEL